MKVFHFCGVYRFNGKESEGMEKEKFFYEWEISGQKVSLIESHIKRNEEKPKRKKLKLLI